MIVTFQTSKEITIVKEIKKSVTELTIEEVVDISSIKQVKAFIAELGYVMLWEGAAYDAIGQWTDADVEARIKELYN